LSDRERRGKGEGGREGGRVEGVRFDE